MNNLSFLRGVKREKKILLKLFFTTQYLNYKEMPDFVRLAKIYEADAVHFTFLFYKPGTFESGETFANHKIHVEKSAYFRELNEITKCSIFNDPIVNMRKIRGMISLEKS